MGASQEQAVFFNATLLVATRHPGGSPGRPKIHPALPLRDLYFCYIVLGQAANRDLIHTINRLASRRAPYAPTRQQPGSGARSKVSTSSGKEPEQRPLLCISKFSVLKLFLGMPYHNRSVSGRSSIFFLSPKSSEFTRIICERLNSICSS
jgi:hypothetical protein